MTEGTGTDKAGRDGAQASAALPPLLSHSMAASVAAATVGLGFANQLAGLWFGVMRGALDVSRDYGLLPETDHRPSSAAAREEVEPVSVAHPVSKEARPSAKPAIAKAKAPALSVARAKTQVAADAKPAAVAAKPAKAVSKAKAVAAPGPAVPSAEDGSDDLKRISGIGPRLEVLLKERGLRRYADIAGLTKAKAKKLDDELGLDGRIARDGWIEAAKALAG